MWIAFKNYYLRDEEKPSLFFKDSRHGCELLSKIIIFVTRNNRKHSRNLYREVVNCFQKLLSSWRGTTFLPSIHLQVSLWIAFKNYYLRDEEQPRAIIKGLNWSCELLSKIIIFVTRNNVNGIVIDQSSVVNCFQKLLSSWRGTTLACYGNPATGLWIAFKNYYLRDEEQPLWR